MFHCSQSHIIVLEVDNPMSNGNVDLLITLITSSNKGSKRLAERACYQSVSTGSRQLSVMMLLCCGILKIILSFSSCPEQMDCCGEFSLTFLSPHSKERN